MAADSWSSAGLGDPQLSTLSISKKIKQPDFLSPNQMVTFVIGKEEEQETFLVHKEHACRYSPVLEKAFNSEFKESQTQKYEMDDTNPNTFRLFVQWLYSQKLNQNHQEMWYLDSEDHEEKCDEETCYRIELWVLAEKLLIPQLQNEVMTLLRNIGRTYIVPFEDRVKYIYENTAKNSPLRRFVVNLIAWTAPSYEYKQYPHLYPPEFLFDLVTVFSAAVPSRAAANKRNRLDDTDYYVKEESG